MDALKQWRQCEHKNVQQYTEICLDCGYNIYATESELREKEMKEQNKNQNQDKWNETGW